MCEFLRLQLLRKLDREKILDVSHYENILIKAFENAGFSEEKKPVDEKDFYIFFNSINVQIENAENHLDESRKIANTIVDTGEYSESEKRLLKSVVRQKFQELFNFFDGQKEMAKTIFDDEFKIFIRQKYFASIDKNQKLTEEKKEELFNYIYNQARYNTNINGSFEVVGEKMQEYVSHLINILNILY